MPLYSYTGINQNGEKISNNIFALSKEDAEKSLKANNIEIISLGEIKKTEHFWQKSYGSVSFREKIIFIKYLAIILKTGLNLKKAFDVLLAQIKNAYFLKIIKNIKISIENGQSFHESLEKYPKVFSPIFINMIAVGEVSGTLPTVLNYLDYLLTKDDQFKRKVRGAMLYPMMILILVVVVIIGLVKFIIPRITKIFTNFDIELPTMTRALIAFEKILSQYWVLIIAATIGIIIGLIALMKVRNIKKNVHRIILKIPLLGPLNKQIQITRFTQMTSTLIKSGVALIKAVEISSKTISNLVYQDYIAQSVPYIKAGGDLSSYLAKRSDLFEPIVTQLVKLGESTGTIDETLTVLAELNEEEANEKLKAFTGLIGPIMLLVMGGIVAMVALSIITPIYQLPTLLRK